jgi:hypothetical protein
MTISAHGKAKINSAAARGWTAKDPRGPCRFLREHRDARRMRRKGK